MSENDERSAREKFRQQVEEAMDDPDQWADEPLPATPRRSEKRQRAAMISVRLSSDELAAVQTEAANRGQSVSSYVRDRALEPLVPRAVHKVRFVASNGTSHDLLNTLVGEQMGPPTTPQISAPTIRLAGVGTDAWV